MRVIADLLERVFHDLEKGREVDDDVIDTIDEALNYIHHLEAENAILTERVGQLSAKIALLEARGLTNPFR